MKKFLIASVCLLASLTARAGWESLRLLDLSSQGLEVVAQRVAAGDSAAAASALLSYYRSRQLVLPFEDLSPITPTQQKWADEALEHKFFVHTGYQPSFFYGEDIDWQYWPVKDNELRWQLHRTKWWVPFGKAYRDKKDEKYAREWVYEYRDWIAKNPLGNYKEGEAKDWTTADNMYFAWRPLEVSDRIAAQITQFSLMVGAESFTPEFLNEFLINYHRHCEHLRAHLSKIGNHRLFEAQRLLSASIFFKEFTKADQWRKEMIDVLNTEIIKQVYEDGVQFELDPHYHREAIVIFIEALRTCQAAGMEEVLPPSYKERIRKMIKVNTDMTFPDYMLPVFSDCRIEDLSRTLALYATWSKVFPENEYLKYLASKGKEGSVPEYTSSQYPVGGFYILRDGWGQDATVVDIKGGPKGEWHCQPDNCTFDYWRKGRNFFPDSGCYVYGGDDEILKIREWYRQTSVHNTLTLDGRNIQTAATRLVEWKDTKKVTRMTLVNPSYEGLTHKRTFTFCKKTGKLTIVDEAYGDAEGEVAIHLAILPCEPQEQFQSRTVTTSFADGNNIRISVDSGSMSEEEGRYSPSYRVSEERPAYKVAKHKKAGRTIRFKTTITPVK